MRASQSSQSIARSRVCVVGDETHPARRRFNMLDEKCPRGAHLLPSADQHRSIVAASRWRFGHLHPKALSAAFMSENR